ncbi:DegV family protein [Legionella sp. km772]|uniref:DegV family protein n=1 Tax=Legionella sp. km772 TaxID=2498111 RepID=UPI000F8E64F0|nr:DegV family protein [Legionella sp. km772]RUR07836.1 DegV family EDD domain-containing protein [Legionella sp. km772]
MIFNELNALTMHRAIIDGCYRVIVQQEELNRINVYPVADRDTGDNMASVCLAIIQHSEIRTNITLTLESIAQAAIIGSRGNSGIIFGQFFIGLHQNLPDCTHLSISQFCIALKEIAKDIGAILAKPVEGTIITLIKKLAEFASAQNNEHSFANMMSTIKPQLKEEVEKTASMLKVVQESKVVDAGALGFYYFMEGFTDFLVKGVKLQLPPAQPLVLSQAPLQHQINKPPKFRYCTEVLLKNASIKKQELLQQFENQGDSAAVIGNQGFLKIHLHTNEPARLFASLYKLGTLKYPKVDDMHRQYEIQFAKKHRIALVTDSSADFPQELLDEYQIHVVPLNIHIGENDFLDKYSWESNYFYNQLQHIPVYPKTSCISPYHIKNHLNRLKACYEHILILSLSSAMSGMYGAFIEASKEDKQIAVLDTKTNSAAHGLLLHYSGQLIAQNLPFVEIIQQVQAAIKNTVIFVLVNQFDSMIRSGRIRKLSGKLASWSHIKPIVSIDKQGRGYIAGSSLSTNKGLNKLIQLVQKQLKKENAHLEDYAIVHADNTPDAMELGKISALYFKKQPLFINTVSLVIGLHAGKGCVAIAARITNRKNP